jgi:hypothetical protein
VINEAIQKVRENPRMSLLTQRHHFEHHTYTVSYTSFTVNYATGEAPMNDNQVSHQDKKIDYLRHLVLNAMTQHNAARPFTQADRVQITISTDGFHNTTRAQNYTGTIESMIPQFIIDLTNNYGVKEGSEVRVRTTGTVHGAGTKRGIAGMNSLMKERSVIMNQNKDNLCLYRAVAICLAYIEISKHPVNTELHTKAKNDYAYVRDGEIKKRKLQREKALELLTMVERTEEQVNEEGGSTL